MKYMRFIAMKYYELIIKLMIKLETVNYFYKSVFFFILGLISFVCLKNMGLGYGV
jgi:hypothetical protein